MSTVVLTRQPSQAGDLEAGLRAAGHRIEFFPVTDFELPENVRELQIGLDQFGSGMYQWLLLTSANAVRALHRGSWDGLVPSTTSIAVTGPGTARVLADIGCHTAPWMPREASAHGIRTQFPRRPTGGSAGFGAARLLLPQSDVAGPAMAEALGEKGWKVDRITAYRTVAYPADPARRLLPVPNPADLTTNPSGTVVLTSPSAAREFAQLSVSSKLQLIAIGQPTEQACHEIGLHLSATAETPDAAGILAAF